MRDLSHDSVVGCFAQASNVNVKIIVLVVLFKAEQSTRIGVKETAFEFVCLFFVPSQLQSSRRTSVNYITVMFTFIF